MQPKKGCIFFKLFIYYYHKDIAKMTKFPNLRAIVQMDHIGNFIDVASKDEAEAAFGEMKEDFKIMTLEEAIEYKKAIQIKDFSYMIIRKLKLFLEKMKLFNYVLI